jgi:hypothetical protein
MGSLKSSRGHLLRGELSIRGVPEGSQGNEIMARGGSSLWSSVPARSDGQPVASSRARLGQFVGQFPEGRWEPERNRLKPPWTRLQHTEEGTKVHRSNGVTILALFFGIVGVLGVAQTLGLTLPAGFRVNPSASDPAFRPAPIRLILFTGCVAFAYGAWRLKRWAWTLIIVLFISTVPLVGLAEGAMVGIVAAVVDLLGLFVIGHVLGVDVPRDQGKDAGSRQGGHTGGSR